MNAHQFVQPFGPTMAQTVKTPGRTTAAKRSSSKGTRFAQWNADMAGRIDVLWGARNRQHFFPRMSSSSHLPRRSRRSPSIRRAGRVPAARQSRIGPERLRHETRQSARQMVGCLRSYRPFFAASCGPPGVVAAATFLAPAATGRTHVRLFATSVVCHGSLLRSGKRFALLGLKGG